MPIDKKKLYQSRKEYKKYCKRAATRSRRGETWSKESLPIVYVDKSEITGTRRPSNEPVAKITGSSESVVLQGMNKWRKICQELPINLGYVEITTIWAWGEHISAPLMWRDLKYHIIMRIGLVEYINQNAPSCWDIKQDKSNSPISSCCIILSPLYIKKLRLRLSVAKDNDSTLCRIL